MPTSTFNYKVGDPRIPRIEGPQSFPVYDIYSEDAAIKLNNSHGPGCCGGGAVPFVPTAKEKKLLADAWHKSYQPVDYSARPAVAVGITPVPVDIDRFGHRTAGVKLPPQYSYPLELAVPSVMLIGVITYIAVSIWVRKRSLWAEYDRRVVTRGVKK